MARGRRKAPASTWMQGCVLGSAAHGSRTAKTGGVSLAANVAAARPTSCVGTCGDGAGGLRLAEEKLAGLGGSTD